MADMGGEDLTIAIGVMVGAVVGALAMAVRFSWLVPSGVTTISSVGLRAWCLPF